MSATCYWKMVLEFTFIKQFKCAIKEWCILNGRDVIMKPNDKSRCKVRCGAENNE